MATEIEAVHQKVQQMKLRFADRDHNMERILDVRNGDIHHLSPDLFSSDLPRSVVANTIDVAAHDLADVMAPLPTLDCAVGNGLTAADKKRAEKKNRIGLNYWTKSRLQRQMFKFADNHNSYGVAVFVVEPDFKNKTPMIRVEDPRGFYYRRDRWGNVVEYAKVWHAEAGELAAMYPEHKNLILDVQANGRSRNDNDLIEMVRYATAERTVVYLPTCGDRVIAEAPGCLSRVNVVIVERPGLSDIPRGQFDDVLWVQLARSVMAQYTLSAADKSINAPIVLPRDVTNFALGGDAVLTTDNPTGAGRMRLDVPEEIFGVNAQLSDDLKEGARYPDARTGGVKGSIITGRGIEAMLGTFDTQLKSAQELFKIALEEVTSLCFEMDARLWPNVRKTITGVQTGRPFEVTYVPARDISESYGCEVTYGFAAGMTPAQSMVALLQLRGDELIGRDTARAQMPFPVDPEKEQRDLDAQKLNDAMMQGLAAFTQAMGPMIQQGMPVDKLLVQLSQIIDARQKGKPLHEAVAEAFKPPEPVQEDPLAAMGAPGASGPAGTAPSGPPGGPGEGLPGVQENGRLQGVAAGQQGMPPGGMPAIQSLIAGLRGDGSPKMDAQTRRMRPLGIG